MAVDGGTVHVIATSVEGTREALDTAAALARGLAGRVVLFLRRAADAHEAEHALRGLADTYTPRPPVLPCVCERSVDVVQLFQSPGLVVIGGEARWWWPTHEQRLARALTRFGCHVMFVQVPHARFVSPLIAAAREEAMLGHLNSTNSPSNHLFRGRGTTPRVDELSLNRGGSSISKIVSKTSPWGMEVTAHAGEDSKIFGFSATAPNIAGGDRLRHLGPTCLSYLAPIGEGLRLQGGIFSSFIGYDSLYPRDNFAYTRPWTADFTPYLMLGVNAAYPVTNKLTVTGFLVNGYWHLAHANDVPSFGSQLAYQATKHVTVKETVLLGPHQEDTAFGLWRWLSNTIVERKTDRATVAFDFHVSSEAVDGPARSRAWWVAGQLPLHWVIREPCSITVRPEFAWDSDGRWTTFEQSVRAVTSTLAYHARLRQFQAIVRLEHRYDQSTGSGGGFFRDVQPGVLGLTPGQHLLCVGSMLTFDAVRE